VTPACFPLTTGGGGKKRGGMVVAVPGCVKKSKGKEKGHC